MDSAVVKDRIEVARLSLGMTIPEFAKHTGISLRTLLYWEHTNREPKMSTVRQIAAATGRPVGWFFGVEEEKNGVAA